MGTQAKIALIHIQPFLFARNDKLCIEIEMPHGSVSATIPASAAEVFGLLHDYDRRLEWDTLLQQAYLIEGRKEACLGAKSVCKGKPLLGGIALTSEYISFRPPQVAAIRMVNRPPFFESFAATIRHTDQADGYSRIEYKYDFTARPRWLQFILHPIMGFIFNLETRKRLAALRRYFAIRAEAPAGFPHVR